MNMKIAIIDEGIKTNKLNHPEYIKCQINMSKTNVTRDCGNHATQCARILENCAEDYELIDIRMVENWNKPTNVKNVILALEKCIEEKVDFICLSAGTEYLSESRYFEKIMKQLEKEKIIVIASLSNQGYMTLPAVYENVLCVMMDWNHLLQAKDCVRIRHPFLGDIIVANIQDYSKQIDYLKGNSYAVPAIMGWILDKIKKRNIQKRKIKIEEIIQMFPFFLNYCEFSKDDWGKARNNPVIAVISSEKEDVRNLIDIFIKLHKLEIVVVYNQTKQIEFYEHNYQHLSINQLLNWIDCNIKCHMIGCFFSTYEKISDEIKFDLLMDIEKKEIIIYEKNKIYRKISKQEDWEVIVCQNMVELLS